MQISKKVVVFYHGNCMDGFGSAYTAWKKFGSKAVYIPLQWTNIDKYNFKNKEIYFLDFTPRELLLSLKKQGNRIVCIDHHISAKEDVKFADDYLFGIEHSGAYWSWQYFHPKKKMPHLIKHISDQDTWQFKMRWTKEISKSLALLEFKFKEWDEFSKKIETKKGFEEAKKIGTSLLKDSDMTNRLIISEGIREVLFEGKKVYAVNSPINESRIGNDLAKRKGLGIVWSMRRNGSLKVSLRSIGNIDVSKIAQKYGGGGHKNSAGFVLPEGGKVPWQYLK